MGHPEKFKVPRHTSRIFRDLYTGKQLLRFLYASFVNKALHHWVYSER